MSLSVAACVVTPSLQASDPGRDVSSRNFGRISLATASPLTATQRHLASCLPAPLLPVAFRSVPQSFLSRGRVAFVVIQVGENAWTLQFTLRHPSLLL
jgi:hypothetical protein